MSKVWLRFVTEKGFTSAAIRWFTWSDWSHVDFVLKDGRFLGARLDGGVQIRPHNYIKPSAFRSVSWTIHKPCGDREPSHTHSGKRMA